MPMTNDFLLGTHDLAAVRRYLDHLAPDAPVSSMMARCLLATLDARTAECDAAYALLEADLTPDPETL